MKATDLLPPDEFLITFVLYADTLLSIIQIVFLLTPCYKTLYEQIRALKTAFRQGFPTVWERISQTVAGPTQVDGTQQVCSGFKGQEPPRDGLDRGGSPEGGRTQWTRESGDELTLVAACRDVLLVISAEEGTDYDKEFGPVIEKIDDLPQPLGEVWTDEYRRTKQWSTIITQCFTTRNTSLRTECIRTKQSASGRSYSRG